MTADAALWTIAALTALAALAIASRTLLTGWNGWLALRRLEIEGARSGIATPGARIEMADLKERIRKLEAIAAGVDI